MFKPTSDFIMVEEYQESSRIALPDNTSNSHKTFIVKDVGPGYIDNGVRVKPEVEIGDRVAIVGKILSIPCRGENGSSTEILIARAGDVIAYERVGEPALETR